MDCTSCEELRELAPEFIQKGVTNNIRENLANNTGYGGKSKNCIDLNLANDCLIGRMPNVLAAYDNCDWKEWARDFSENVYNMLGSMIAAWCQLTGSLQTAPVKILYTRNVGSTGSAIDYWYMSPGSRHTVDVYIDAKTGTTGTSDEYENITIGKKPADRDYAVLVTHCFDMQNGYMQEYDVTWYSSSDTGKYTPAKLREERGQHPEYKNHSENNIFGMSWPVNEMVYVKKGDHLQCEVYCRTASPQEGGENAAKCRVHQIAATWIPINSVEVDD